MKKDKNGGGGKKSCIDKLLGEMRDFAKEHHIPISTPESIETIDRLLGGNPKILQSNIGQQWKPKHCLEIGTCIGYGTIEIARRIQQRGGTITSYEISSPNFVLAQSYIKESGLSNIELIFQDILKDACKPQNSSDHPCQATTNLTLQTSGELQYEVGSMKFSYDFVYIDGQKSKYLDFLLHIRGWTTENAIILFDDVLLFPDKTKVFWDYINKKKIAYQMFYHSDGDAMLLIERGALPSHTGL